MNFVLKHATLFRDLFKKLHSYTSSISWVCTAEGMNMYCIDSSHISYCNVYFSKSLFAKYQYTASTPFRLGFHVEETEKFLRAIQSSYSLHLSYSEQVTDSIHLKIFNGNGDMITEAKAFKLFNDETDLNEVKLTQPSLLVLATDRFKKLIDHLCLQHETVAIQILDASRVSFVTEGQTGPVTSYLNGVLTIEQKQKLDKMKIQVAESKKRKKDEDKKDDEKMKRFEKLIKKYEHHEAEVEITLQAPIPKVSFGLKHLKMFADMQVFNKQVHISISNVNEPLQIQYTLDEDPLKKSFVRFYLASRLDQDNEVDNPYN